MAARKYGQATALTGKTKRYKTTRPDKYEAFWGTPGSQASLRSWSLRNVRHPLVAWADEVRELARRQGTPDEFDEATKVWLDVRECVLDFTGVRRWRVRLKGPRLEFVASIVRV